MRFTFAMHFPLINGEGKRIVRKRNFLFLRSAILFISRPSLFVVVVIAAAVAADANASFV